MAGYLRLNSRCWLKLVRPVSNTTAARPFSVTTRILADKQPTQAPKSSAPPKPAAASTTKGKSYEVPEYYAYNEMSYYDMESAMRKDRLPQPKPGQPSN